jgi:hypothetical protein
MIVLHPNEEQYNALNGYTNGVHKLIFAIDGSGRYIVGIEVLNDPNFIEIREQLLELEQITYTPAE